MRTDPILAIIPGARRLKRRACRGGRCRMAIISFTTR